MNQLKSAIAFLRDKSPQEIADLLRAAHVTGRPGTVSICPLANYLRSVYHGRFVIGRKHVYRVSGTKIEKHATPKCVADFIRTFDLSGFSDMLAPPPRVLGKTRDRRKADRHKKPQRKYPRQIVNHLMDSADRYNKP